MSASLTGQVEQVLIAELKKALPEYDVESFPSNFEGYTFTSPNGCLLVKYVKTTFAEQGTIWDVNQNCTVKFTIIAGFRGFNKYSEIHEPLQQVKDVLTGLEIAGRKIYLTDEQFLAEINTDLYCGISLNIDLWQDQKG